MYFHNPTAMGKAKCTRDKPLNIRRAHNRYADIVYLLVWVGSERKSNTLLNKRKKQGSEDTDACIICSVFYQNVKKN